MARTSGSQPKITGKPPRSNPIRSLGWCRFLGMCAGIAAGAVGAVRFNIWMTPQLPQWALHSNHALAIPGLLILCCTTAIGYFLGHLILLVLALARDALTIPPAGTPMSFPDPRDDRQPRVPTHGRKKR